MLFPPQTITRDYHGCACREFAVDQHRFIIAEPANPAPGRPWVWRAEFFAAFDSVDAALLKLGWHIVHCPSAAGMIGSPPAVAEFDACHRILTDRFSLNARCVAEGFSRGGLLTCNYALAFPHRILAIYNDAPVLDIRSWPGGKAAGFTDRLGPGDPACWKRCLNGYNLTPQTASDFDRNPIDLAPALASHRIPVIIVVGDIDTDVPVNENTAIFEQRYRAAGGEIHVIHKPHCAHHPHSLDDPAPVVDFLLNIWRTAPPRP